MLETKRNYTEEDMILLDERIKFIPLTYDKLFKGIFKENLELLKIFILEQIEIDVNPDECKILLYDSELPKFNKNEYQKNVDLFVKIHNIYVNVEINREYFKTIKKRNLLYADRLYSMILEQGENLEELENRIFVQINLNAVDKLDVRREKLKYGTDKLVTYGIYSNEIYDDNKYVLVKYLEYYRDLYYNKKEKLSKADLWMVLLTSKTFQELYNVSLELLGEKMHSEFMRKVINMVNNKRFFEDWEIEQLNAYVDYKAKQDAREDGLEEGLEQTIKNMLKEGLDIALISRISGKTEEEINEIAKFNLE